MNDATKFFQERESRTPAFSFQWASASGAEPYNILVANAQFPNPSSLFFLPSSFVPLLDSLFLLIVDEMALQTATQEDPLTRALRPMPGETPDQRSARLEAEALAKTISTEIDEYLKKEAQKRKEHKVKLLLLGEFRVQAPAYSPHPVSMFRCWL
jgi:hypothetical protein